MKVDVKEATLVFRKILTRVSVFLLSRLPLVYDLSDYPGSDNYRKQCWNWEQKAKKKDKILAAKDETFSHASLRCALSGQDRRDEDSHHDQGAVPLV